MSELIEDVLGKVEETSRGFEIIRFKDLYRAPCSLQASSLADDDAIWLGCDDAEPKVLASEAHLFGIETKETTGWVPYPIPEEVLLTTRMHLNHEQVAALITHLQSWLNTGTFKAQG